MKDLIKTVALVVAKDVGAHENVKYLTAQRDELLLALENIAACPGDNRLTTAIQWAKAAIINHKEQDENRSE